MIKTAKITAALVNYANVYRTLVMSWEVKPYNVDVAIEHAVADIYNMVKNMKENEAVAVINDDALYIQEKMAVAA